MSNEALITNQATWRTVRDSVAHDGLDTTLGDTARKWADKPASVAPKGRLSERLNAPIVRFRATTSITSFDYKIWVYRENDDAEFVCGGVATMGTQEATMTNGGATTFYAAKITITERWLKPAVSTDEEGNDEMAKVAFDACGAKFILIEIYDGGNLVGTGSISADIVGF